MSGLFEGSPRNVTVDQLALIRGHRQPPPEEATELPPPAPGRIVPLTEVGTGPARFAAAAQRAGFVVHAVRSRGPLLNATGGSTREVDVVSIRCCSGGPVGPLQVQIAAAWADGKFDVAFGRRKDDTRRVTQVAREARAWLDTGVEGDVPDMRDAAKFVARALGATMIGVRTRDEGGKRVFTCPEPLTDAAAVEHLRVVHKLDGGDPAVDRKGWHEALHMVSQNHRHERWPLGEPPR